MAKKKEEVVRGAQTSSPDGSRAINKFRVSDFVMMLFIVLLCATCVVPFVHLAAKSISGNSFVIAKEVYFWPKGINFDAYVSIFKDGSLVYSMGYSVVVTLIFTVLGMIVCTCAAYPLSKKRLKGRTFFTIVLMIPMYFTAGVIPTYLLMNDLNLLDTMWVLIWPLIYSPYNMLIMKTNLQASIPDSLEESAQLDGGGYMTIFVKIISPLCKPVYATVALFVAVGQWNSWFDAMLYNRMSSQYTTLQYELMKLLSSVTNQGNSVEAMKNAAGAVTPTSVRAAATILTMLPIICLYPFLQRYFVTGLTIGGVKE